MEEGNLEILVDNSDSRFLHISLKGDFDSYGIKEKGKELTTLVDNLKEMILLLDLSELNFINSQGIGQLLKFREGLSEKGQKLIIVNAKKNVLDVLNAIGIFETVTYFQTLPSFFKSLDNA